MVVTYVTVKQFFTPCHIFKMVIMVNIHSPKILTFLSECNCMCSRVFTRACVTHELTESRLYPGQTINCKAGFSFCTMIQHEPHESTLKPADCANNVIILPFSAPFHWTEHIQHHLVYPWEKLPNILNKFDQSLKSYLPLTTKHSTHSMEAMPHALKIQKGCTLCMYGRCFLPIKIFPHQHTSLRGDFGWYEVWSKLWKSIYVLGRYTVCLTIPNEFGLSFL